MPIPEVAPLGRTLRSWRVEFLAYFDTGGASNGPTEAIEKHHRDAAGLQDIRDYRLRLLLACGLDWQTERTGTDQYQRRVKLTKWRRWLHAINASLALGRPLLDSFIRGLGAAGD